ncbi:MAG: hypothetical protein C4523_08780 [Myxococcales bacterium]|nr:MAG: hypothetical protein C4523_08780 [Myxococcales bacterium]
MYRLYLAAAGRAAANRYATLSAALDAADELRKHGLVVVERGDDWCGWWRDGVIPARVPGSARPPDPGDDDGDDGPPPRCGGCKGINEAIWRAPNSGLALCEECLRQCPAWAGFARWSVRDIIARAEAIRALDRRLRHDDESVAIGRIKRDGTF